MTDKEKIDVTIRMIILFVFTSILVFSVYKSYEYQDSTVAFAILELFCFGVIIDCICRLNKILDR